MGLLQIFRKPTSHPEGDGPEAETAATGALVTQARAFQELRIGDVMKPRADIVAVDRERWWRGSSRPSTAACRSTARRSTTRWAWST
jgi:hypothetical protein